MHSKDHDGRHGDVIDTMVFIYLFEDHPSFGDICENLFNQIKVGVFSAIVTQITAAEVLVKPLKIRQFVIADKYRNAIRNMPNISNIKFDVEIGFMAGSLRAKYGLPLPDILQVAAALAQPANTVITNDRDIQRVRETNVFLLSDLAT
ncbi:MAG: type II toxin-antitoxin system VapC family toxin [Desulfobacterales bacterium]|jgi:predicted nucleic acid-binding protein